MFHCNSCKTKKALTNQSINQDFLQLRLSPEEISYYKELYYSKATNGTVSLKNFPPLLGMLGTQIAKDFAEKIFNAFSSDRKGIKIGEYLKYLDVYHYGDDLERCKVTCRCMDENGNGQITKDEFKNYIKLIINAVRKVTNGLSEEALNETDIENLFYNISKGNEYFTYFDFEKMYQEKPELISWIDYFKSNNTDLLLIIHSNVRTSIKMLENFFNKILESLKIININNFNEVFDKEINKMIMLIENYSKEVDKKLDNFLKHVDKFNIRMVIDNLVNNEEEAKKKEILKSMHVDSEFLEKKKLEQTQQFFQNIKKQVQKKNENNNNEIIENHEENISNSIDDLSSSFFDNFDKEFNEFYENKNNKNKQNGNYIFGNKNEENLSYKKDYSMTKIFKEENEIISSSEINNTENKKNYSFQNTNNNIFNKSSDDSSSDSIIYNSSEISIIDEDKINKFKNKSLFYNKNSPKNSKENGSTFFTNHTIKNFNKINNNLNLREKKKKKTLNVFHHLLENKMNVVKDFFKSFEIFIEKSVKLTEGLKVSYKWLQKSILNQKLKKIIKQEMLNVKNIDDKFATKNVPKKIKKVKKKIIKAPDESFKILLNMIMGIQIAVQATPNYKINEEKEDITKYLNSMLYSIQTTNLVKINPEIFFLKEYAGIIFNNIRLLNGFDKDKFIMSISPQDFITELMISSQTIFEELCSTGKSGSLFYYTRDGNFIVKTIAKCEYKFLKKILPNYYLHLKKNPLSLLPKFFGCYQLIRKYKKSKNKINFIVMMNVFKTSRYIHIRFDLKGSKIGRKVLSNNKKKNEDILNQGDLALKDLDLEEKNIKTYIGRNKSELFFNQLKKDVDFLCNVGSIDYSLLLGIHYINRENQIKKKKISKMKSVINKCKSNKDLIKSDINNNNNNIFRRNNMLHKTKTLVAKKISMNSSIVTNGNDNFYNTYNKFSFTDNNINNKIINNNENINNVINTNENNNNNNNNNENNNNNKLNSFDEDFLSFFEDDDKSYKERLEEVHKLFNFDDGGIISENGNEIIFLGIIDILTEYNCKKSTEHFFKMLRYCSNDMSCVNPIYYKDRFFNYMKKVIEHGDPNIKNRFNKLYYQETTTDNDIKNQFISNDNNYNNNVKENDVDIIE